MSKYTLPTFLASLLGLALGVSAAEVAEPELVDIRTVDPTIVVELRYAGNLNIAQRPLYSPNMPALVRPSVAAQLVAAQNDLLPRGYRLKIWDAYRPKAAHDHLWERSPLKNYVANPADGMGSLHTWGVAVDATLIDDQGRDVKMPTDFDDFTPAALLKYTGADSLVRFNLRTLQRAMGRSGFYGMRTEWWHFVAKDWAKYKAVDPPPPLVTQTSPVLELPRPRPIFGSSSVGSR